MIDTYNGQAHTASVMGTEFDKILGVKSRQRAIMIIVHAYLEQFDPEKEPPTPEQVQDDLLGIIRDEFRRHNQSVGPEEAFELIDELPWNAIAEIIYKIYVRPVKNLKNKAPSNAIIKKYIYRYNNAATAKNVDEILKRIKDMVEIDNEENWMTEDDVRVNEFKQHILSATRAGCLPSTIIGVMYQKWHRKNYPEIEPYPRNLFLASLKRLINPADGWYYTDTSKRPKKSYNLNVHDPLLEEFQCSKMLAGLPTHIRGLFRIDETP